MTTIVISCQETSTLDELMEMMTQGRFRHVPRDRGRRLGRHRLHRRRRQEPHRRGGDGGDRHAGLLRHRLNDRGAGIAACRCQLAWRRTRSGDLRRRPVCAPGACRRASISRLHVVESRLAAADAALDQLLGPMEVEQAECRQSRRLIMASGGSPASRERAMRSCTMLKASTITRGDAGRRFAAAEELALQQLLHARGRSCARDRLRLGLRRGLGGGIGLRGAARSCRGRTCRSSG